MYEIVFFEAVLFLQVFSSCFLIMFFITSGFCHIFFSAFWWCFFDVYQAGRTILLRICTFFFYLVFRVSGFPLMLVSVSLSLWIYAFIDVRVYGFHVQVFFRRWIK